MNADSSSDDVDVRSHDCSAGNWRSEAEPATSVAVAVNQQDVGIVSCVTFFKVEPNTTIRSPLNRIGWRQTE